jgi:hypothetical protein
MPAKKKPTGETPELPPAPAVAESGPVSLPATVKYEFQGQTWRCSRFPELVAELGQPVLTVEWLGRWQDMVSTRERTGQILRRLFGLSPLFPSETYPVDELRVWSAQEIMVWLGLTKDAFQQEMEVARGIWRGMAPQGEAAEAEAQAEVRGQRSEGGEKPPPPTDLFAPDPVLAKFDIRVTFTEASERHWFIQRVTEFEKLLLEKMTSGLARDLLMTEFQMRRVDGLLSDPSKGREGSVDWRSNMKVRKDLGDTYRDQLALLNKIAPWASGIAGKYAIAGVISDFTLAYQEYYAEGTNKLADGIFTALEIQVLFRRSQQAPEPKYRFGLVGHLHAARAGLFDPAWKPPFSDRQLKMVDAAGKAALIAAGDEMGEPVPDLEAEGPAGEYPPLVVAAPAAEVQGLESNVQSQKPA